MYSARRSYRSRASGVAASLLFFVLVLGLLAPRAGAETTWERTNDAGMVEMSVTYLNPTLPQPPATLNFQVKLSTHSVDLDGYRLEELASLRNDGGQSVPPAGWFNEAGGGHHRRGELRFPAKTAEGQMLIGPQTQLIEMIVRDIAGVKERRFQWKLR
ncbi:MAG: hypothetical protein HYY96_12415 [Candidatus Tectomicrobia bacterium]|nr:hypothetical protein [Candidatus Tectomicrobia bacterium]